MQGERGGDLNYVNDRPIADMLTRIRNTMMVRHKEVEVPASKLRGRSSRYSREKVT